jgi:hypothetical protein
MIHRRRPAFLRLCQMKPGGQSNIVAAETGAAAKAAAEKIILTSVKNIALQP